MTPRPYYRLDTLLVSRDVLAVHAHRKRRHHHPGADGYERHLVEAVPGRRGRAQRRAGGPRGRRPLVWVHTRWVVPRDRPRTGLRELPGSRKVLHVSERGRTGKGLSLLINDLLRRRDGVITSAGAASDLHGLLAAGSPPLSCKPTQASSPDSAASARRSFPVGSFNSGPELTI